MKIGKVFWLIGSIILMASACKATGHQLEGLQGPEEHGSTTYRISVFRPTGELETTLTACIFPHGERTKRITSLNIDEGPGSKPALLGLLFQLRGFRVVHAFPEETGLNELLETVGFSEDHSDPTNLQRRWSCMIPSEAFSSLHENSPWRVNTEISFSGSMPEPNQRETPNQQHLTLYLSLGAEVEE